MRNNETKTRCSYGRNFQRTGAPGERKGMTALQPTSNSPRRLSINQCASCNKDKNWKKDCLHLKHERPPLMAITKEDCGRPEGSSLAESLITAEMGNEEEIYIFSNLR